MNKSEEIQDLAVALAKAQGEMENPAKTAENPHFRSKYADLPTIINVVRPVLAKHNLSVIQFPGFSDGVATVETTILHSSGQWISNVSSAPVDKQNAQAVGSAITYLRRYSLAATCNLGQEDDDAESAIGRGSKKPPTQKKPEPRQPTSSTSRSSSNVSDCKAELDNANSRDEIDRVYSSFADGAKKALEAYYKNLRSKAA